MAQVSNIRFSKEVDAWVGQTNERMEAVWKEATQRTVAKAQAYIPVDTGYARASVRVSTDGMPQPEPMVGPKGGSYTYDSGLVSLAINGAELGDVIYVGWTAPYAIYLEFGHSQQAPSGFVGIALAEWPATIDSVVAELRRRSK